MRPPLILVNGRDRTQAITAATGQVSGGAAERLTEDGKDGASGTLGTVTRLRPLAILVLLALLPVRIVLAAWLPCAPAVSVAPVGQAPVVTRALIAAPAQGADGAHRRHADHSAHAGHSNHASHPVKAAEGLHHSDAAASCPHCAVDCCLPPVPGSIVTLPAVLPPAADLPLLEWPAVADRAEDRERPPRRL